MKRLLYIAILLIANISFAQGYTARIQRFGTNNTTFTHLIDATYTAYHNATVVDTYTYSSTQNNEAPTAYLFSPTLTITSINIAYNVDQVEGGNFGNCFVNQTVNVTNPNCFTFFIDSCRDFNIKVYNTQTLLTQPANNTICIDDLLPLQAANDCFGRTYNWEYTTNLSNAFQSLGVQSSGTNSVNVDLSTFLSNGYTGNVFIRARVNGKFTNTITYTVISCTPGIISVITTPTTCNNSSDGGFVITFDETLSNEQILFVLKRDNASGPIISSFTTTISGTTYTWPNALPQGTYYLDYQSTPAGSVISYPNISINAPTAVTFTASWTDVDCFGTNTGSISINASGGAGNYQYSINNGSSWLSFSNANSHAITNLSTGNYQVKVRDSNSCVAQQ